MGAAALDNHSVQGKRSISAQPAEVNKLTKELLGDSAAQIAAAKEIWSVKTKAEQVAVMRAVVATGKNMSERDKSLPTLELMHQNDGSYTVYRSVTNAVGFHSDAVVDTSTNPSSSSTKNETPAPQAEGSDIKAPPSLQSQLDAKLSQVDKEKSNTAPTQRAQELLQTIDLETKYHAEQHDGHSYLRRGLDWLIRVDGGSESKVNADHDRIESDIKSKNNADLSVVLKTTAQDIRSDEKRVEVQNTVDSIGATGIKIGSMFVPGPAGWIATAASGALDEAHPTDNVKTQVVDGALGAGKSLITRGLFGGFGLANVIKAPSELMIAGHGMEAAMPMFQFLGKGAALGGAMGLTNSLMTRSTYKGTPDQVAARAMVQTGTSALVGAAGLFIGSTLVGSADSIVGNSALHVEQGTGFAARVISSPFFRNEVFAGSYGFANGAINEASSQIQHKDLNPVKVIGSGIANAFEMALVAAPGSAIQQMQAPSLEEQQARTEELGRTNVTKSDDGKTFTFQVPGGGTIKATDTGHAYEYRTLWKDGSGFAEKVSYQPGILNNDYTGAAFKSTDHPQVGVGTDGSLLPAPEVTPLTGLNYSSRWRYYMEANGFPKDPGQYATWAQKLWNIRGL